MAREQERRQKPSCCNKKLPSRA